MFRAASSQAKIGDMAGADPAFPSRLLATRPA